jgi:hypothetical protein
MYFEVTSINYSKFVNVKKKGSIMTAQAMDSVFYKGEKYSLVGKTDGELATPARYGMESEEMDTGCYRGYIAEYEITETQLYLREFRLRERNKRYLPIGSNIPEVLGNGRLGIYSGLFELIPFTGKIRIAKEFIKELYIHMGFQKPTSFRTVLDISLEHGRIVEIENMSVGMKSKRGRFVSRYEEGNMVEMIHEAFSLDMDIE